MGNQQSNQMNSIIQKEELKRKFSDQILFNEPLSKYSWFNLGGAAKVIFKPSSLNELSNFLKYIGISLIKIVFIYNQLVII